MTQSWIPAAALGVFVAVSLACGSDSTPPAPGTAPTPAAAPEPSPSGFGALFERDEPVRRAHEGDTAEPAAAAEPPAAAAPVPSAAPATAEPATAGAPTSVAPAPAPAPASSARPSPAPTGPSPATATPQPATAGYKAIVAFYGGAEPEDFAATVAGLRSAASGTGIQVVLAPAGADRVRVDGGSVDISAFRAARDAGFVFAAQGRGSVFAYYPPQTPIRTAASSYFGVSL